MLGLYQVPKKFPLEDLLMGLWTQWAFCELDIFASFPDFHTLPLWQAVVIDASGP